MSTTSVDHHAHAYLKWPRLIAFNVTGALAVAALGLNARAIINLENERDTMATLLPGAKLHAANVVAVAAVMTAAAGLAALYCLGLTLATLFGLHRQETKTSIRVKEICMAVIALILMGSAIAGSIIIVPRSAGVSAPGLPQATLVALIQQTGKSLKYKDSLVHDGLIVVWVCFATTLIAFVLAALTSRHIKTHSPEEVPVGYHTHAHVHGGTDTTNAYGIDTGSTAAAPEGNTTAGKEMYTKEPKISSEQPMVV